MATRDEWNLKLKESGARQADGIFTSEYVAKFEHVAMYWMNKNDEGSEDFIPLRNKFAKEMRKDGWKVKSSSAPVMGRTIVRLEAERAKNP